MDVISPSRKKAQKIPTSGGEIHITERKRAINIFEKLISVLKNVFGMEKGDPRKCSEYWMEVSNDELSIKIEKLGNL